MSVVGAQYIIIYPPWPQSKIKWGDSSAVNAIISFPLWLTQNLQMVKGENGLYKIKCV